MDPCEGMQFSCTILHSVTGRKVEWLTANCCWCLSAHWFLILVPWDSWPKFTIWLLWEPSEISTTTKAQLLGTVIHFTILQQYLYCLQMCMSSFQLLK
jgi:hypothetical protein